MTSSQCQQTAEDWFNKNVALHDQGNYADAIQALDEAIRLSPNDPNNAIAWNNKGLALYSQGEYDEAIKAYEEGKTTEANAAFTEAKEQGYSE